MPRYYCDYCNTYLTHDSIIVRRQHNSGYRHRANVRTYYEQFEQQQTQSLIDQRIKEHLSGQEGAFQIGAAHAAWRPGVMPPVLPAPLPIPGSAPPPPRIRLPVLPRPAGIPVYGTAPVTTPVPAQPGVPGVPAQPGVPGVPAQPGVPVYGTAPVTTPVPAQPGVPGVPTQPGVPGTPVQANGAPSPPGLTPTTSIPGSIPSPPGVPQSRFQNVPAVSIGVTSMPTTPISSLPAVGNASYPPTSGADGYTQDPSSNN